METLLKEQIPAIFNGGKINGYGNTVNYEDMGHEKSKNSFGKFIALENNLKALYEEFKQKAKNDIQRQNLIKTPFKKNIEKLNRQNSVLEGIIKKEKEERIPSLQNKIELLKDNLADIKSNPQSYLSERIDKAGQYIGITILLFLTLYLFIFYSSASYSGFFRNFEPGVNLREAMLDPKAFINAFYDGIGELLFILTMPFIFLSLGYLIHKFNEKKSISNYLKVTLILIVAVVFEGVLAYKITEGIYSVNIIMNSPEFTIIKALKEINFWVVIFAGFVTYIVWGILFDFVIKAHRNSDQIGTLIRINNEKINDTEDKILQIQKNIDNCHGKINKHNLEKAKYEDWMEIPLIETDDLNRIHYQFMTGWKNHQLELKMSDDYIRVTDNISLSCLESFKEKLIKTY